MLHTIKQIQTSIASLPENKYIELRHWIIEGDWQQWDEKIEKDSDNGKLDFLLQEAFAEKRKPSGRIRCQAEKNFAANNSNFTFFLLPQQKIQYKKL